MPAAMKRIDIRDLATNTDILRLVDEVKQSNEPRLLVRDTEEVAVLSPVKPARQKRRRVAKKDENPLAWLQALAGIGSSAEPTDIAAHKDEYIAEAIYPRSKSEPERT